MPDVSRVQLQVRVAFHFSSFVNQQVTAAVLDVALKHVLLLLRMLFLLGVNGFFCDDSRAEIALT